MTGAMRGFGAPQVCFAYESHMDDIAKTLGIDPLEIRLHEHAQERVAQPDQPGAAQRRRHRDRSCRRRLASAGAETDRVMKRRGRGIACMWYPIGFTVAANPSAAVVKVNEDGTATLLTGTVETGQGSLTVLGADRRRRARHRDRQTSTSCRRDTDTTPMDTGAIASRTTYVTGNAARLAAARSARRFSSRWPRPCSGRSRDQLEVRDHKIQVKNFPQRNIHIGDVADRARRRQRAACRSAAPASTRRPSPSTRRRGRA